MAKSERAVAVVTGAARSLGRAIAETLHGQGFAVALADVDEKEAARVAASLDLAATTARAYRMDVSKSAEVAGVFEAVARDLGVPGALVNNAGVYPDHGFLDMPETPGTRCSTST